MCRTIVPIVPQFALTDVRWRDWRAAVRVAVRHLTREIAPGEPLVLEELGSDEAESITLAGDTSLFVEISPGIEINRLTDIALKSNKVKPWIAANDR